MAPPAKRPRRNLLPSSSSSEDDASDKSESKPKDAFVDLISSSPLPIKGTRRSVRPVAKAKTVPAKARMKSTTIPAKPALGSKVNTKSPSTSPGKKSKGQLEDKIKSGNIYTFFTKQVQKQQSGGGERKPSINSQVAQTSFSLTIEDDDLISDDEYSTQPKASSLVGQAMRKRARGANAFKNEDPGLSNLSQKFMTQPRPPRDTKPEEDTRPWAERFGPVNLDELAVHKKKVAYVRTWLEDVIEGRRRQRLLVLKGAAGTGKTTTIQLLAKAMDCDILEWRNPVSSVDTADGYQSAAAQFEEFMGRGGRFGQLDIFSENAKIPSKPDIKPLDRRKQIILVEEFPNTFTRSSTALQSFRSALIQYLVSNTPALSMCDTKNAEPVTPVVMIISETLLTTTSASADSFTAHRLLGPEILQHPGLWTIEFNAIATSFLTKALELVVQKESRKSGRKKTPGPAVLKKLGEIGDVRSAVGSLEFMCLRGDTDGDWGSKVTFSKTKKASKDTVLTTMEAESLELITRREASLGIFHAVGKVVYNKRDENKPVDDNVERLPGYMFQYARPRKSDIQVDQLIDETGTDTQTFVAALHENYILSCDASASSFEYTTLDHVNGCIDGLSDSDLLCPSWDGSFGSTGLGGGNGGRSAGGDILMQDEMSFQIAVRGIIFSLPNPVKRKSSAPSGLRTGKRGEEFRMFYPTSLKLWRMKEEIETSIDMWVTRLMKGEGQQLNTITAGAEAFAKPKVGTVESWKSAASLKGSGPKIQKDEDVAPLLAVGTSARKEMLLERLPYMALLAKACKGTSSSLAIREMEKVTAFRGIGGPPDDNSDDGDDAVAGEEWTTDKPGDGRWPRKKGLVMRGLGLVSVVLLPLQEQKLVLSDDDIEDD
ncbi:Rad17 cell cycle checkpoint protein-domain-containing protein [Calycina marina]|uniref:Rad17 cell cycle checkpoint protein-domain-containing protein n=1 Tax=Calycina marina TaxID=1763456 RepID=A0A9P7Z2V9_9HELO|nr:Rad17 cell cycle checkpoint protein-domain-containing protein [Calycina marina]